MNANRRKQLQNIIDAIEEAKLQLETLKDEEQECFDNLPESFQYSERGERMEEIIGYLEDAFCELESAIENITESIQ